MALLLGGDDVDRFLSARHAFDEKRFDHRTLFFGAQDEGASVVVVSKYRSSEGGHRRAHFIERHAGLAQVRRLATVLADQRPEPRSGDPPPPAAARLLLGPAP